MYMWRSMHHCVNVALRKESVDRNIAAQRSWKLTPVALRKESVDRNSLAGYVNVQGVRRSPQGERG